MEVQILVRSIYLLTKAYLECKWQPLHSHFGSGNAFIASLFFFREVNMEFMSRTGVVGSVDVISGILNWVCPGCGGRMGGRGKEFKCQGECLSDWRLTWQRIFPARVVRPGGQRRTSAESSRECQNT